MTQFEACATSIYRTEQRSWLQILPQFTVGEPRSIVQSFGMGGGTTYAMVKERLKAECERRTFGANKLTDFYGATRRPSESLLCYSIRLQSLVRRLADMPEEHQAMMVKTKFISCLKPATVTQISIRYGNEDVEFGEIVRLAQLLENEEFNFSASASTSTMSRLPSALTPTPLSIAAPNVSRNVATL